MTHPKKVVELMYVMMLTFVNVNDAVVGVLSEHSVSHWKLSCHNGRVNVDKQEARSTPWHVSTLSTQTTTSQLPPLLAIFELDLKAIFQLIWTLRCQCTRQWELVANDWRGMENLSFALFWDYNHKTQMTVSSQFFLTGNRFVKIAKIFEEID